MVWQEEPESLRLPSLLQELLLLTLPSPLPLLLPLSPSLLFLLPLPLPLPLSPHASASSCRIRPARRVRVACKWASSSYTPGVRTAARKRTATASGEWGVLAVAARAAVSEKERAQGGRWRCGGEERGFVSEWEVNFGRVNPSYDRNNNTLRGNTGRESLHLL